jgi:thioredoxin 1
MDRCDDGACPVGDKQAPDTAGVDLAAALQDAAMPVLAIFSSKDCGPCQALALFLPKLATEFRERLRIVEVDGGDVPELTSRHEVKSFPTLLGFFRDTEIARRCGFDMHEYPALREWISSSVAEATGTPASPDSAAEHAFAAAVTQAVAAYDTVVDPLLEAAVAAQEPHLPAFRAALAQARAERAANRITEAELRSRRDEAAQQLREATGASGRELDRQAGPAGDALERAIRQATETFAAASE